MKLAIASGYFVAAIFAGAFVAEYLKIEQMKEAMVQARYLMHRSEALLTECARRLPPDDRS